MAGIPMTFGWGGCHGAVKNYHAKGYFLNMDVGSLYPSIMINFPEDCFSRAVPKEGYERFKEIKRVRLELKHQGKKKEQAPYKIVLNGTYGAMKDRFNKLYDPKAANNVCIYGMLLVGVDLLERLEETHCCKIIQVNTDGILIQLNRYEDYDLIDDVAYEWEKRTGLDLEFDDYGYGEIYQKDVNNYLVMDQWGHYKSKGEWIKSQNRLDYDLPIVNEALINYMTKKIPVEQTINQCNDLHKFQMVRKISNKYSEIRYGGTFNKSPVTKKTVYNNDGEVIHEKCVRIFASKKLEKGTFYKKSISKGTYEKLEDAPEHAFMDNGAVEGKRVPRELDKSWYIEMAKKRLAKFGI
jgi:DNA polymerase